MKPNCICSFSGSDKAPSELLHFYVGVDCVWKLFLGASPPPPFFFKATTNMQRCLFHQQTVVTTPSNFTSSAGSTFAGRHTIPNVQFPSPRPLASPGSLHTGSWTAPYMLGGFQQFQMQGFCLASSFFLKLFGSFYLVLPVG